MLRYTSAAEVGDFRPPFKTPPPYTAFSSSDIHSRGGLALKHKYYEYLMLCRDPTYLEALSRAVFSWIGVSSGARQLVCVFSIAVSSTSTKQKNRIVDYHWLVTSDTFMPLVLQSTTDDSWRTDGICLWQMMMSVHFIRGMEFQNVLRNCKLGLTWPYKSIWTFDLALTGKQGPQAALCRFRFYVAQRERYIWY